MTDPRTRYLDLIDATLRHAVAARSRRVVEPAGSIDCGLAAVAQVLGLPIREEASDELDAAISAPRIVDGAGHSRPMYRGLLVHAMADVPNVRDATLKRFAQDHIDAVRSLATGSDALSGSHASQVLEAAFGALAVRSVHAHRPTLLPAADADSAADALRRLVDAQLPEGTFLRRGSSDNPEPLWYAELALLHAVSTFAWLESDDRATAAAACGARYHAEQVQPDHASSHPWAIHATLDDAEGIHLADMMLHAAGVQQPATMDTVSLLLLADALRCRRPRESA